MSATLPPVGARPVILCRDHLMSHVIEDVDAWTPKHFDDSLEHPSVVAAASYRVAWSLPAVFSEPGCRVYVYVASDMDGLVDWVDSDELRDAIADGEEREAQTIPVDGDMFTGNIYAVAQELGSLDTDFVDGGGIFVERYEVPEADSAAFDEWFNGPHLRAVAAWPGALRARTWVQNRDVPKRFPYDRYTSVGNRMLTADFGPDVQIDRLLAEEPIWQTIADGGTWDARLPYGRREAGTMIWLRPDPASPIT
jgi:hypothetical protein